MKSRELSWQGRAPPSTGRRRGWVRWKKQESLATSVTRFGEISPFWLKFLKAFNNFQKLYQVFGNILNLFWQKLISGKYFIVVNGQISNNNLHVWSHCLRRTLARKISERERCRVRKQNSLSLSAYLSLTHTLTQSPSLSFFALSLSFTKEETASFKNLSAVVPTSFKECEREKEGGRGRGPWVRRSVVLRQSRLQCHLKTQMHLSLSLFLPHSQVKRVTMEEKTQVPLPPPPPPTLNTEKDNAKAS